MSAKEFYEWVDFEQLMADQKIDDILKYLRGASSFNLAMLITEATGVMRDRKERVAL
jgi:hypothetical protein